MFKVYYRFDFMCVNGRFVTNRYTGQTFWSECGKCEACLQKKAAARSNRIRNEYSDRTNVFFVTLTYDRLSAPYFNQSELNMLRHQMTDCNMVTHSLHIYRRYSIKWNVKKQKYFKDWHPVLLDSISVEVHPFSCSPILASDFAKEYNFNHLQKQPGKIGVIYFPDVQNFNKRLRQQLKICGYDKKIKIYDCMEYGPDTIRPHAHLLIFAPDISLEKFHHAVIKSWPYGRRIRDSKSCQLVTDDPAGYVSSYVNCTSSVPPFLARYFKQRHSASKYFGHGRKSFVLEEIQKKALTGDLTYDVRRTSSIGEQIVNLPIPKYVINRYFPLFKGSSRLTSHEVLEFLSRGFDVGYLFRRSQEHDLNSNPHNWIGYTIHDSFAGNQRIPSDLRRISTRFKHAFEYYKKIYPDATILDYSRMYDSVWLAYRSTVYKKFVTDDQVNDFYKYDNIAMLPPDRQQQLHKQLGNGCVFIVDNNKKPHYVNQTFLMKDMFYKYQKQKKITNIALNGQGILV